MSIARNRFDIEFLHIKLAVIADKHRENRVKRNAPVFIALIFCM